MVVIWFAGLIPTEILHKKSLGKLPVRYNGSTYFYNIFIRIMMHDVCSCERLEDPRRDAHSCMALWARGLHDLRKSERQVLPLWARD
jgi:hypothetical protein